MFRKQAQEFTTLLLSPLVAQPWGLERVGVRKISTGYGIKSLLRTVHLRGEQNIIKKITRRSRKLGLDDSFEHFLSLVMTKASKKG